MKLSSVVSFCVLMVFLGLTAAVFAQADSTVVTTGGTLVVATNPEDVKNVPLITSIISQVSGILKAADKGSIYAILVAICNLLVAVLKNKWIQGKLSIWSKSDKAWMTKRQKVFLTLTVGVLLVAALAPKATIFWTIAKGLEVALCSIGTYTVYKHLKPVEALAKE